MSEQQQRPSRQQTAADIWRQSFPFLSYNAEQMNRGIENPQWAHEVVSPDGFPMSFHYHHSPQGDETDMPDYVPSHEPTNHEPVAPVYEDEHVPGRAVLQGYEAPNERVQYLLSDLSKRAIRAVSSEIDALPANHQPPNFDFNTVLNVPGPHTQGGNGSISPPVLPGYGITESIPCSQRPARRVIDLDSPPAPLPAKEKRETNYDEFEAAQRILEPPPPMPPRNHGSDSDEVDISAPVQDPDENDQITPEELPFTLSLEGTKNLRNIRKWPVPSYAPRNDLGYSYMLLNKALKRLQELNTRLPYTIRDFERVCTEQQMNRLKRWIHLPGAEWTQKEDIELFELIKQYGKSEDAWLTIASEMRMFYATEAYNRYQVQQGYDPYFQKKWSREEDKALFDLWADPQVRQRVYEEFVLEYPHRTRRSSLRRLEKLYMAAIGRATLDTSESEEPDSYEDTDSDDNKQGSNAGVVASRTEPSFQVERGTKKRDERSPENPRDPRQRTHHGPVNKKQRRDDDDLTTSTERVRQTFQDTTQAKPIQRRPLSQAGAVRNQQPVARQVPFSRDQLNLLWELHNWEYPNDTPQCWERIARQLNVKVEQPGSFVRGWYIALGLDRKKEFPLPWTREEDALLQLWSQNQPEQWMLIASKLQRRTAAGCQRRSMALDRSPTDFGL